MKIHDFYSFVNKGVSRSVALVAGYMMYKNNITCEAALNIIRERKPDIDPNIGFVGQLQRLEEHIQEMKNDEEIQLFDFSDLKDSLWINDER